MNIYNILFKIIIKNNCSLKPIRKYIFYILYKKPVKMITRDIGDPLKSFKSSLLLLLLYEIYLLYFPV